MDKKVSVLLGAAAALAMSAPASYAELLAPIPNPIEALKADEVARVQLAGWVWNGYQWQWRNYERPYYYHHHHHHHHHHHSHHHHHHYGKYQ